ASLELKPGLDIAPTDLAELLVDAGFSREDPADQHGEFAVRGGIVDIFPAGEAHPIRLEFIGDTIESLRTYDPATQRSLAAVDQIAIVPLRDVLNDDRRATIFDYFARAKSSRIIVSEYDEIETHANKLLEQFQRSYSQATGAAVDGTGDVAVTPEEWDELGAGEDAADLVVERAEIKARRRAAPRSRPVIDLPSPGELFIDWEFAEQRLAQATRRAE